MNTSTRLRLGLPVLLALVLGAPGCSGDPADSGGPDTGKETAKGRLGPTLVVPRSGVKRTEVGRHVWLETEGDHRHVRVEGAVCLREGEIGLEFFMCRKGAKEYESIVATSAGAQVIHKTLLAAGAEAGSPARFNEGFEPPHGSEVKLSLEYEDKGKLVSVPAGYWVRDVKTKKELESVWVFGGSLLWDNPDGNDKPKIYAADNDGAYVSVINLPTAMLDLPVRSVKAREQRSFEPFTEHIPEVGTPVVVIFEPVIDKNAAKSTEPK